MPRAAESGFSPNGLVTLTTDFGTRDGYVGAMKGVMLSIDPALRLHDLAHDLPPQDVRHGAAVLRSACPHFPRGTVHLAVVDPGVGGPRAPLVVIAGGHALVGPDNGLLALAAAELGGVDEARRIDPAGSLATVLAPHASSTFHGRDLFAPTAAALASGRVTPAAAGPLHAAAALSLPRPERRGAELHGEVLHFDRFGNAVTNFARADLPGPSRTLRASLASGELLRFVETYGDAEVGEAVALLGSDGLVELAVRDGSARERLGLAAGAPVHLRSEADARGA